jgi:hypothetical protein
MVQSVDEVNLSFLHLPLSAMPFTIPDAPGLVTSTIKTQNPMSMTMRPKSDTIMRPGEDEASSLLNIRCFVRLPTLFQVDGSDHMDGSLMDKYGKKSSVR